MREVAELEKKRLADEERWIIVCVLPIFCFQRRSRAGNFRCRSLAFARASRQPLAGARAFFRYVRAVFAFIDAFGFCFAHRRVSNFLETTRLTRQQG